MSERKRKRRGPFGFFGFGQDGFFLGDELEPLKGEGGYGYSMSVAYDESGKPVVKVKTHGEVDVAQLRKEIEQRYPGAKIEGLEKQPLIRVVGEETAKEIRPQKNEEKRAKKEKEKKKPLIRTIE